MKGRVVRFFITPQQSAKKYPQALSGKEKIYGYSDVDNAPCLKIPDVTLFGGMTQSYCKTLAVLIYVFTNVRMRVPSDYEHYLFGRAEVTLPFVVLTMHLRAFVGEFDELPSGAIVSMARFFDYLHEVLGKEKEYKNPLAPH